MDLKKVQLKFIQSKSSNKSDDFENLVYWPASLTPCDPKFHFLGHNKLIAQSDIQYQSFDDVSSTQDEFNYFLAPLSSIQKNGKLICKPAKVFKMLPSYDFKDEMRDADEFISNRLTKREQLDELKEKFGSKRSQRDLANKRKYEIQFGENDSDDLPTIKNNLFKDSENLDSKQAENKKGDNKDILDMEQQSSLSTILPERNEKAKNIEQVYSIDDIITEQERKSILDHEDQLFDSIKDDYIQQILKSSSKSISQNQKVIAIYADLLIQLVKLTKGEMKKPDPLPSVVGDIKKYIFERYTSTEQSTRLLRYVLTDSNKDRIFIYVCILLITLNQFKPVDLDKLQTICKAKIAHIRKIVELIGCHIEYRKNVNGTVTKIANLRLPLNVYKEPNNKLKRLKR